MDLYETFVACSRFSAPNMKSTCKSDAGACADIWEVVGGGLWRGSLGRSVHAPTDTGNDPKRAALVQYADIYHRIAVNWG